MFTQNVDAILNTCFGFQITWGSFPVFCLNRWSVCYNSCFIWF